MRRSAELLNLPNQALQPDPAEGEFKYLRIDYNARRGRPVKYTERYINRLATLMLAYYKQSDKILIEEFAASQGIASQRFTEFCAKSAHFKDSYARVKDVIKIRLVKHGLRNKFNVAPVISVLKNEHSYIDKPDPDKDAINKDEIEQLKALARKAQESNA